MGKETMKSKILIFGGTGYLGNYMVKASLALGYPTFVYARPLRLNSSNLSKLTLHQDYESMGVTIFQGELNDHDKLVSALTLVDVVISTLAVPQYLDQLKIIEAMKEVGTIKRFVPSEYGNEVDRVTALPPFQAILNNKKKVRRATEMANIPYTYVSANSFAGYFIDYLLHPNENVQQISVYGTGNAKAVLNYERDVAMYTVKAATDRRACNRVMIIRPPTNIICQNDLISAWEKKTARKFMNKMYIPEEQLLTLSQTLPHPDNIPASIIHNIFIKGDQLGFNLREDDLEASSLFPDYEYTSIDHLLDIFAINPPKAKLSVFA